MKCFANIIGQFQLIVSMLLLPIFNGYSQVNAIDSIAIPLIKKSSIRKMTVQKVTINDTVMVEEVYLNAERNVYKRIRHMDDVEAGGTLLQLYDEQERLDYESKADFNDRMVYQTKWNYVDSQNVLVVKTNSSNETIENVSCSSKTVNDTFSLVIRTTWPREENENIEYILIYSIDDNTTIATHSVLDDSGEEVSNRATYRTVIDSLGYKTVTEGTFDVFDGNLEDPYLFENYDRKNRLIKSSSNGFLPCTFYEYSDSLNVLVKEETWDWRYVNENETEEFLVDQLIYKYDAENFLISVKSMETEYIFNYTY